MSKKVASKKVSSKKSQGEWGGPFAWTEEHRQNPVLIERQETDSGVFWEVFNEGGEPLSGRRSRRIDAVRWCFEHDCFPIPRLENAWASWGAYHGKTSPKSVAKVPDCQPRNQWPGFGESTYPTLVLTPQQVNSYISYSGELRVPDNDTDITLKFGNGKTATLQWRIESDTLDICFSDAVSVFNWADDMQAAPSNSVDPCQHTGVLQLCADLHGRVRKTPKKGPQTVAEFYKQNGSRENAKRPEMSILLQQQVDYILNLTGGGKAFLEWNEETRVLHVHAPDGSTTRVQC